jgi:hypothetical protein
MLLSVASSRFHLLLAIRGELKLQQTSFSGFLETVVTDTTTELWRVGEADDVSSERLRNYLSNGGDLPITSENMHEHIPVHYWKLPALQNHFAIDRKETIAIERTQPSIVKPDPLAKYTS